MHQNLLDSKLCSLSTILISLKWLKTIIWCGFDSADAADQEKNGEIFEKETTQINLREGSFDYFSVQPVSEE